MSVGDKEPEGDAPVEEIGLTPKMIEAGVSALCSSSYDLWSDEQIVTDIFTSMYRVR